MPSTARCLIWISEERHRHRHRPRPKHAIQCLTVGSSSSQQSSGGQHSVYRGTSQRGAGGRRLEEQHSMPQVRIYRKATLGASRKFPAATSRQFVTKSDHLDNLAIQLYVQPLNLLLTRWPVPSYHLDSRQTIIQVNTALTSSHYLIFFVAKKVKRHEK